MKSRLIISNLNSRLIISNHNLMIWNQDLLYQIINLWFKIRIYYIKSWTYDLKSGSIISNHKLMIWNQDSLYQIINAWFEIKIYYIKSMTWYRITKLYLVNNEKNYKIKLNHFFYKRRPISVYKYSFGIFRRSDN